MATNHTTNYQLNLWEPGDAFLRTEFNENSSKIDAALAAHDSTLGQLPAINGTLSSHTTALANHATSIASKAQAYLGTYAGSGKTSKTLTFPFQPKLVVVIGNNYNTFLTVLVRGQTQAQTATEVRSYMNVSWSGNNATLSEADSSDAFYLNLSGQNYCYIGIG